MKLSGSGSKSQQIPKFQVIKVGKGKSCVFCLAFSLLPVLPGAQQHLKSSSIPYSAQTAIDIYVQYELKQSHQNIIYDNYFLAKHIFVSRSSHKKRKNICFST